MRNSENGKYDALLTRTAVYFCTNYCFMLASAVFLCWLCCLKWWCIVYFMCFAVFFFDCSSSRFEKNERAAGDACWLACVTVTCMRAYVRSFFLNVACLLAFGNVVKNYCLRCSNFNFKADCWTSAFFYYCTVYNCMLLTDAAWGCLNKTHTDHSALRTMWLRAPVLAYVPVDFSHWLHAPP